MNATNIPGFTAEASLYRPVIRSWHTTKLINIANKNTIVPQVPKGGSCGACTPLRWPNGTPTGACSRACIQTLGDGSTVSSFEACACGAGSSGLGGLGWGWGWGGSSTSARAAN
jgi:hypothetical protein